MYSLCTICRGVFDLCTGVRSWMETAAVHIQDRVQYVLSMYRCMDVDGDGVLSMYEIEYFYEEQLQRMEQLGIETLPFDDCICQVTTSSLELLGKRSTKIHILAENSAKIQVKKGLTGKI